MTILKLISAEGVFSVNFLLGTLAQTGIKPPQQQAIDYIRGRQLQSLEVGIPNVSDSSLLQHTWFN